MDFDPDLPPGLQFMRLYDLIIKVVKHFVDVDKVNPQRLSAVGYSESWPLAADSYLRLIEPKTDGRISYWQWRVIIKMSNKIIILLIGVVMVLMLGMGGGLFMMWNKLSTINVPATANTVEQPGQEAAVEPSLGKIVALETFIVNLADKGGNRYLRVTMDLELGIPELETELNKRLPQVRDSILMILPSKRFEDISSVEGKIALRNEIMETLNGFLTRGQITSIYFKEFVVQ